MLFFLIFFKIRTTSAPCNVPTWHTSLSLKKAGAQKESFFLRYLLTESRSFLPRQSNSCVSSPFSGRQFSAKGMARAWGSSTLIFWSLVGVSLTWLLIRVKARNSVQHYSSECGWRLMRSMRCTLLWDACWHIHAPRLSHKRYFQRPSLPQIFSSGHALVHHHLRIPHWSNSVSLLEEYFLKHVTSGVYALKHFNPAVVWVSGVCRLYSISLLDPQASRWERGGRALSGVLQLWESGSLETVFWSHLPPPSTCGRHAGSPTPSPSYPLPQTKQVAPSLLWTPSPFPSSSSPAAATVSRWCLPVAPHPHPPTTSTTGRVAPGLGFFSVLQVSLKTPFPREPSYLVSTTGGQGQQIRPFSGCRDKQGVGGAGGEEGNLAPSSWATSGFHRVGKYWAKFMNMLNVTFSQWNTYWVLSLKICLKRLIKEMMLILLTGVWSQISFLAFNCVQ